MRGVGIVIIDVVINNHYDQECVGCNSQSVAYTSLKE